MRINHILNMCHTFAGPGCPSNSWCGDYVDRMRPCRYVDLSGGFVTCKQENTIASNEHPSASRFQYAINRACAHRYPPVLITFTGYTESS